MDKVKIVVVSLFDGLSGGRIALSRVKGIKVKRYYSSEIDPHAIKIADKNYPKDTKHRLGSVVDVDGIKLRKKIRKKFGKNIKVVLIGGSPCQGFSLAGKLKGSSTSCGIDVTTLDQYLQLKNEGFEFDGQSFLFWEYVRIMKELEPTYFFLENVRVTGKWFPMFNDTMGVEPILINSNLVSAQNRQRYYWTNIPNVTQPKDKGIMLKDVLESGIGCLVGNQGKALLKADIDKSACLLARDYKGFGNQGMTGVIDSPIILHNLYGGFKEDIVRIFKDKSPTLRANSGGGAIPSVIPNSDDSTIEFLKKIPLVELRKLEGIYFRKLTPLECERLQTLPEGYTEGVSNSQRYKMIGNGWTIDVITHIFKGITNE